jgi:hypothetical protein
MERSTHTAVTSAASKAASGMLTFEEFLDFFSSHNRIYNDEVQARL